MFIPICLFGHMFSHMCGKAGLTPVSQKINYITLQKLILDVMLCILVGGCWAQYQQSDQTEHENQVTFHPR